jgi:hypothetical protein
MFVVDPVNYPMIFRYMGTITGISDLDLVRWKNSQWCNLQVRFLSMS